MKSIGRIRKLSLASKSMLFFIAFFVLSNGYHGEAFARRQTILRADFNGDGFGDLPVGAGGEDVGYVKNAGAMNVFYGSPRGLSAKNNQYFTMGPALKNWPTQGAVFGEEPRPGDFNGDGYVDLAIGACETTIKGILNAGEFNVMYGSPTGLTFKNAQKFTMAAPQQGAFFAEELNAGDFNGDGIDDIAIGTFGLTTEAIPHAGGVWVMNGSPKGLSNSGIKFFSENIVGKSKTEKNAYFGEELEAADYNGDGYCDLAIGAYQKNVGSAQQAGALTVLYGSFDGLTATGAQFWTQESPEIPGVAEKGDWLGDALCAGDFNGDGYDDIGVAIFHENVNGVEQAGGVMVLYGSIDGLTADDNQLWTQDQLGGTNEKEDQFSWMVAAADFDDDGFTDMAVSARKTVSGMQNAGSVYVLYGSPGGLNNIDPLKPPQIWTGRNCGILDYSGAAGDNFGWDLTTDDFNGDGHADLAISVVNMDVGAIKDAGAVIILYGSPDGLTSIGSQLLDQNSSPGIKGDGAETGDLFGLL